MRIGDLAAMAGVSTRTVRHYHHIGLLPEPPRLANGYREYRLRDAVLLVRVRRLTELGLSLDEIRDTLHDDQGRDLREVLLELDADLARQQADLAARRERLADLLAQPGLNADSTTSPDLAAVLHGIPTARSRTARLDRDLLVLADSVADAGQRTHLAELVALLATPEAVARGEELYARFDALDGVPPGDPRIAELTADLIGHLPAEVVSLMAAIPGSQDTGPWLPMLSQELSPAQAEVFRQALALARERGPC